MAYNIGPKIGIDGEKEFRDSIKKINDTYKALDAETRALTASFEAQGDEQGKLEAASKQLQKQIEKQKEKQALLDDAVKKATAQFGAESIEATRLRGAMYDTQATVSKLENELKSTDSQLENMRNSTEALSEETTQVESELKSLQISIAKVDGAYKLLNSETKAITASFDLQGDKQGKLEATSKQLQKQIDNQREKIALLETGLQKASDEFGEASDEANHWRTSLYDTQATVSKLESELKDTSSGLESASDAMEDLAEEADDAGDAVLSFGDVLKANLASGAILNVLRDVGEAVKDVAIESIESAADIRAASAQFEQAFGDMADTAEDSLDAIADETKIAATRMKGSYTEVYAFAKSVGSDSVESLDMASRAMLVAADRAAYYDKSIEEVTESLQAFLKGNYANDAALGIAATETTRNAKANELYAKSFKDLSESQKVDVLLSMVEAGNAASGALGQAAREAGEWTNVNGELAESWRQFLGVIGDPLLDAVIPVIQGVTDGLKWITEEISTVSAPDALAASMKDFEKSIKDANDQFAKTEDDIYAAAYAANHYTDRLAELEAAGLDNAVAQQEYALVVEELNKLVPDLNLTIDEQTGLVNKNIAAIRGDIAAWQEYATATAMQEKFSEILRAQGSAKADLITAQARLNMLVTEGELLEKRYADSISALDAAQNELNEAQREHDSLLNTTSAGWLEAAERLDAAKANVQTLTEESARLGIAVDDNHIAQKKLNREIGDAEKTLESYSDEVALAEEANKLYSQSVEESNAALDEQTAALTKTEDSLASIRQVYADARTEALDSINSQIGLFEELTMKSDYSASKILENWEKQQQAFLDYRDNLQKAVDMGLDEALVQQLSDGSQQSMMILDALVNDTETSIDEINDAFGNLSDSKDLLAYELGQMRVVASEELSGLVEEFETSGANAIDGLISGVTSRQDAFGASVAGVGRLGRNSFNKELAISSPARKMIPSGEFTVDGAIIGVESRTKAFEDAMSDLALAGENAYLTAQLDRVGSYPSMVQAPASYSRSVAHNYGGIHIDIHQQPGESGEDLAYRVMEIMQQEVEAKEAGIGA